VINDLKPYPAMKDTGVQLLGEAPRHWEVSKLRNVLSGVAERNRPDLPLLSVVREKGVILRDFTSKDDNHNFIPDDLTNYKVVREGQFVMNKMKAWQGSYGVSRHTGIVSPAYFIFDINEVEGAYFHTAIRSKAYIPFFTQASDGVRIGQWDLSPTRMKEIPFFIPPRPEQAAIVRFLDCTDRRIRRYIRAKQKLIKLLEEQKQGIIHRAVTRGLDPDVRLKPSGVEWLGDIPKHWSINRLKFVASEIVDCLHATPIYSDTGAYPAIRTADVVPGQLLLDRARCVDEQFYRKWTARMTPTEGDILYTREGERFGIAALVPANVNLCISQRMMAFRINPKHNSDYVMWQINCQHVYVQAAADLIGSAAPHVNVERIKNFWLAIPPRDEQDRIVAAVENDSKVPASAIQRAYNEIRLLREYRTRLIADVVTGKLDVRKVAVQLPEEIEDQELLDDADAPGDDSEDANGGLTAASEEEDA
jgi:type I restriction enzyme S subunit